MIRETVCPCLHWMFPLAVSLTSWLLFPAVVQAQPAGVMAAVEAAARARQDAVRTVDVRFRRHEVTRPGGKTGHALPLPGVRPKGAVPEKETTLDSVNRLVIDSGKVRYEDNHPTWRFPPGEPRERTSVSVYNGAIPKTLFPTGSGGSGTPQGFIHRLPSNLAFIRFPEVVPLTFTFRPLDLNLSRNWLEEMKPSGTAMPIDGTRCLEFIAKHSEAGDEVIWLDPARDYVVRRFASRLRGVVRSQVDVRYRRQEPAGWVPESWVRNEFLPNGVVTCTTKVEVLEMRLNEPQAADQFDVVFPAGTMLFDNRADKRYWVESDGSLREFDPGLDRSGATAQSRAPWYRRHQWLLTALGAVLLGSLFLVAARWRRRRNLTATGHQGDQAPV